MVLLFVGAMYFKLLTEGNLNQAAQEYSSNWNMLPQKNTLQKIIYEI
jgi:hypothetical protein